ncbi:MAG: NADH-quinone oxidoreductase subunit F, partial [Ectothiorhodospiraceae bacterium]|nr:NADH-quinone oxidoreductase subunit F [Ectothiorhodospiraceae bacterium]
MTTVKVGLGTCGVSAGAEKTYAALKEALKDTNIEVSILETGCMGMCYREPLVEVSNGNGIPYLYGDMTVDKVGRLVEEQIIGKTPIESWIIHGHHATSDDSFLNNQTRIVLRNCGNINPNSIDDYVACNGYAALKKMLSEMQPEDVVQTVLDSGLRGRGGGGFLTGMKWKFAAKTEGEKKYVICNADEGDPGAFMDRSVLEGDPHSIIEGMAICAYAIGADEGYVYVRAEYPKAIKHLRNAISQAKERGYLGKNIFGSDFNFQLKIKEGAGAFVCGEETALINSIEG